MAGGAEHGEDRQAGRRGGGDRRGEPDRRRGGEPAHRAALHEDQAGADEPEPGDDLRRHPGRVDDDLAGHHDVLEAVLADQQEQGGPQTDDGVRAQPGGLLPQLPLQPDRRRQPEREGELADLQPTLAVHLMDTIRCTLTVMSARAGGNRRRAGVRPWRCEPSAARARAAGRAGAGPARGARRGGPGRGRLPGRGPAGAGLEARPHRGVPRRPGRRGGRHLQRHRGVRARARVDAHDRAPAADHGGAGAAGDRLAAAAGRRGAAAAGGGGLAGVPAPAGGRLAHLAAVRGRVLRGLRDRRAPHRPDGPGDGRRRRARRRGAGLPAGRACCCSSSCSGSGRGRGSCPAAPGWRCSRSSRRSTRWSAWCCCRPARWPVGSASTRHAHPRPDWALSAASDTAAAGTTMWIGGTGIMGLVMLGVGLIWLHGRGPGAGEARLDRAGPGGDAGRAHRRAGADRPRRRRGRARGVQPVAGEDGRAGPVATARPARRRPRRCAGR